MNSIYNSTIRIYYLISKCTKRIYLFVYLFFCKRTNILSTKFSSGSIFYLFCVGKPTIIDSIILVICLISSSLGRILIPIHCLFMESVPRLFKFLLRIILIIRRFYVSCFILISHSYKRLNFFL